jgi:ferric-dicitrate binding protein FerR (iron transport regulator)
VELEGEAYFEVASNKAQPFIVITPMEQVEVVGTHFNVHAYTEETLSKVALLEGKVKVSVSDSQTMVLQPGQQTVVQGNEIRVLHINPEESIAWKNGEFMFNNENLGTALKQIARWYDIHIQVDPTLENLTFWGSVSKFDNFDKVLKIIKMADDDIKINIEGRRVKVMR